MWGSQGWNQWALQPAMFNDVPHEQIDWAELAKQWIQMQQTQPSDSLPPPPPQMHQGPPPPVSIPPPPGHGPLMPEGINDHNINPPLLKTPMGPGLVPELFHSERPSFEPETGPYMPKSGDMNFWNKPQWDNPPGDVGSERMWSAPPIEPVAPILPGKETFDYGHMHDNPPLAMQTIDYNHMSDYSYNQQIYTPPVPPPVPETQYDQYWSQVNAAPTIAPIFLKKERTPSTNVPAEEDSTQLDAAKRKQLPAWIRDGLEKMEQERLKRLEKEKNAKEQAEKLLKTDSRNDLNLKSSPTYVPKSKFDSDSEDEQAEEPTFKRNSPIKRLPSPVEDTRTEEERKQDLMLKVRRTLTEVLLSVTNSEMVAIAQEIYKKAKLKAPARQLASSTSLSSVATGLRGLASYDTGSDVSDVEEGNDSTDSEEELYRRIKEKKKTFALKEKKIIAELERKELEEKTEKEKMNNGNTEKNEKDSIPSEALNVINEVNSKDKVTLIPFQRSTGLNDIPFISEQFDQDENENNNNNNDASDIAEKPVKKKQETSESSSSSGSDSDSSERVRKKSSKKSKRDKSSKRGKSPSKRDHSKRNRSRDSDSSERLKRGRSPEKSEHKSSRKHKKSKRSDSSSSSSSVSHKKKYSSKHSSSHNSSRERRSHSYEDHRYRHSDSPSKSRHRNDGHSHKSSHSHRYHDDKYSKRYKEDKKYRESRKSPSPRSHSSKLPRKYRTSRSLSSESELYGKKSKKYRTR